MKQRISSQTKENRESNQTRHRRKFTRERHERASGVAAFVYKPLQLAILLGARLLRQLLTRTTNQWPSHLEFDPLNTVRNQATNYMMEMKEDDCYLECCMQFLRLPGLELMIARSEKVEGLKEQMAECRGAFESAYGGRPTGPRSIYKPKKKENGDLCLNLKSEKYSNKKINKNSHFFSPNNYIYIIYKLNLIYKQLSS